ncbi:HET-domain-containing protein, partial [Trichoderma citrinoviride]
NDLPLTCSSPRLPRDTSSQQSFQWAIGQIEKCNRKHKCHNLAVLPSLPTRVLDVEAPETGLSLYLADSKPGRYMCLSHCWGQLPATGKTTRHNLELRIKGILLESLPKTFQDAIDMTRRLGVRYLWIDALCIIQEDEEDWLREAPQMAAIYENAYLTLAATASSDSHGGFYRILPPEAYEREFTYGGDTFEDVPAATVYVREALPHFNSPDLQETSTLRKKEFPLFDRAWAYQERVLSPRMLHFCNSELWFECNRDAVCQCKGTEREPLAWKATLRRLLQEQHQGRPTVWGWNQFVLEYSGLKMTYDKDRLPALSSIARKMAQLNPQDCYLAGMWKSTLLESLFWSIAPGQAQRYRPSHPRAPSWSWAS